MGCDKVSKQNRENIVMRRFSLPVICFALFLCGTASAQQALVEHNQKDDACASFKMRILAPANGVDSKLRAQQLNDRIDNRMVWNPCPGLAPQFAFELHQPAPHSVRFQLPGLNRRERQAGFPLPQLPSPFDRYLKHE